jgi:hypothetical protein
MIHSRQTTDVTTVFGNSKEALSSNPPESPRYTRYSTMLAPEPRPIPPNATVIIHNHAPVKGSKGGVSGALKLCSLPAMLCYLHN